MFRPGFSATPTARDLQARASSPGSGTAPETHAIERSLKHRDERGSSSREQTNLLHDEHVRGIVLNCRDVRTAGARGSARASGVPRSADESGQPSAVADRSRRSDEDGRGVADQSPWCSSTSTTSRPSTTASATRPVTSSCASRPDRTRLAADGHGRPPRRTTSSRCLDRRRSSTRRQPTSPGVVLRGARLPTSEIDGKGGLPRASVGIWIADRELEVRWRRKPLGNADVAMYMAKRDSKGGLSDLEPRTHERARRAARDSGEPQRAIDNQASEWSTTSRSAA